MHLMFRVCVVLQKRVGSSANNSAHAAHSGNKTMFNGSKRGDKSDKISETHSLAH